MSEGRLSGRRALVTGGSRGIGAAIVRRLAAEGATVAVNYVSDAGSAESLVNELRGNGTGAARLPAGKSRLGCSLLRNPTSIAIAWGEPVCGCNLHPLKSSAFSRRTVTTSVILG